MIYRFTMRERNYLSECNAIGNAVYGTNRIGKLRGASQHILQWDLRKSPMYTVSSFPAISIVMRMVLPHRTRMHKNILAPEWTNYWKRVQYQAYDVTELVKASKNELRIYLGNGWYSSMWQDWPPRPHIYGEYPELLLQMEIEYEDGSKQRVISDESWEGTNAISMRFSDIYEGEKYDACIHEPYPGEGDAWHTVAVHEHPELILTDQKCEPIEVTEIVPAQSITATQRGTYVVDFGQNLACRLVSRFRVPRGTEIKILHNEMLNPDGTVYMDDLSAGCFVTDKDRQVLRYIASGDGEEEYRPHFTYMGFRYAGIFGLPYQPEPTDFLCGSYSYQHALRQHIRNF